MAKNRLNDFDATASNNTDVGGVGIQGSDKPSNLDDAIRQLMALLANWRAGTSLNATANFNDPTDTSKVFAFSGANIPTATARSIDAEGLYDLAENADDIIALLTPTILQNYLAGYTLSNNVADANNDLDIAAGVCIDSTNTGALVLASGITKRLDAVWAVGTNQGGLDTGSAANVTYHVYAIKRVDTGVVDVIFSTSANSPALPTNYTLFRRIGSILRLAGFIVAFSQKGDEFLLDITSMDVDVSNQGTAAVLRALTVPLGIKVDALMRVHGNNASTWGMLFSSPDVADRAPSFTATPLCDISGSNSGDRATLRVRTNTSAQIRTRSTAASTDLRISTYGWVDTRGK